MRTRPLGRSGLEVTTLCLGTMTFGWTTDEKNSFAVMSRALERGINFFDTANIYSRWSSASYAGKTEEIMGRWFAEDPSRRGRVVLATKVRGEMSSDPKDQGLGRAHITAAIEASLKRLRTDHVELYQSHAFDASVAQDETLRAYEDLVRAGKVRAIGCSNYSTAQLTESLAISKKLGIARYESVQPEYSLLHRDEFERDLAGVCAREQVGVIPYSPLAGGFLTGKYRRGAGAPTGSRGAQSGKIGRYMATARSYDVVEKLEAIAKTRGTTIAGVALAWVVGAPAITSAILGANTVAQLDESLAAADLELTPAERAALDALR